MIPPERDPVKHVEEQLGRLEQALGDIATATAATGPTFAPRVSVWEADDSVFVCVNLPGVQRSDLRITLSAGKVVVEGQRNLPRAVADSHARPSFGEDAWGRFRRVIPLPPGAPAEGVEARLQDGLLTVAMRRGSKTQEAERTIPVN